jgi:hypothetical protein
MSINQMEKRHKIINNNPKKSQMEYNHQSPFIFLSFFSPKGKMTDDGHLRSPVKCLQLVHLTGWLVVAIKTSHLTHLKRSKLLFSYFQKR